ncbi:MAG: hypothetical protein AB1646_16720 [Thermodesulfobacteriota bacterium]
MTEEKQPWTVERIRQEIYDARTTVFVITKVLETGNINFAEMPEWGLVIRPLLTDMIDNARKILEMLDKPTTSQDGS